MSAQWRLFDEEISTIKFSVLDKRKADRVAVSTEPEPDLSVVRGTPEDFRDHHPLVVETLFRQGGT